jgi:hypothetical protein
VLGSLLIAGPAAAAPAEVLAPPPPGTVYQAANAGFGHAEATVTRNRIRAFERAAGKPIAWAYFSNNWTGGIHFPSRQVRTATAAGTIPFIRMEPRSTFRQGGPDRRYTMQSILTGGWDAPSPGSDGLVRWCQEAAATGSPLLVEFGTEVNGSWFPWNGRWNGGARTGGYGDPSLPDGPERFRDAYRHVVDVCRAAGAANITWFFHVDAEGSPAAAWNSPAAYYPGDGYVDWIGVSAYGSLHPKYGWHGFARTWERARRQLRGLSSKPIAVLETGVREDFRRPARKAEWITRALRAIRARFPEIRAVSWWNERYRDAGATIDLRIDSSPQALRAYRRGIANRAYTSQPEFLPR